jgi:biotin carboxylase
VINLGNVGNPGNLGNVRVLLFSTTTGYQLRAFGDAARELGVEIVFATDRCHSLDDPWRDAAIAVRWHDEDASLEAVVAAGRDRPIDGILAVGDRPVVLAARAAEALGLRGHPPDAARASTDKRLARQRWAAAGLPVPRFLSAKVGDDVVALARELEFPVVIKPAGLSGSRGVMRADTAPALAAASARLTRLLARPDIRAQRTGTEDDLLIEQFIPGREYAIEGLLTDGALTLLAIFDKPDPLDGPFFEETIYTTPSALPAAAQDAIVDAVRRAATALGLRHGPIHAECRVNGNGVFVLEVAARPIGGLCSRVLRFVDTSAGDEARVSLEHLLLRHAVGAPIETVRREPDAAAVMMMPIPRRGIFRGVTGEDDARQVPHIEDVTITAKPDQLIEPLPEAAGYLGFIFSRAGDARVAERALREAYARLVFTIAPAIDVRAVGNRR